ncbi:MAG: DUF222 domain-containing protein, partial [Micromonosporaceae bacterium]|nr:DUF222 domain-containing protein [Micromonosporaceae bacterium]
MDAQRGASSSAVNERPRTVPAGIIDLPPGRELAVLLESVDQTVVDADELEHVLRARARQIWHLQAELMVDLYLTAQALRQRIGMSEPPTLRRRHTCEYVGWRLGWSARWAQAQLDLADALLTRFPDVFAAMQEGRLDPARAAAFVELLSGVDDEATVQWIVDRLLPKAPRWTLAELRERLRYHVHRRAPQAAKQRGQKRVAARDVQLREEPDGTASLTGVGLPAHRAVAAFDRVDRLAGRPAPLVTAGPWPSCGGDAFCDLLAGVPFQVTPSVDPLTTAADADHPQPDQNDRAPGSGRSSDSGSDGCVGGGDEVGPEPPDPTDLIDEYEYEWWFGHTDHDQRWVDHHRTDPHHSDTAQTGRAQTGHDQIGRAQTDSDRTDRDPVDGGRVDQAPPTSSTADDSRSETGNRSGAAPRVAAAAGAGSVGRVRGSAVTSTATDSRFETGKRPGDPAAGAGATAGRPSGTGDQGRTPTAASTATNSRFQTGNRAGAVLAGDRCGRCGGQLAPRPGVLHVSVKLTTLLGRDDHPGLLAGFGPIPADAARQLADDPVLAPLWRWSVFDPHGDLLHHGTT